MQNCKRKWNDIRNDLNARLAVFEHGPNSLSDGSGISYFAARRFLKYHARNQTSGAIKLCKFFNIQIDETAKVQTELLGQLTVLVAEVWDGTVPHAELLTKLIKSTKHFRVEERSHRGR